MARLHERVFTDADFYNGVRNKAKPGEIWAKVKELDDLFESVKDKENYKNRRMRENLMSYNGRPRTSFNSVQEAADIVEIDGVKYKKLNESTRSRRYFKEAREDVKERAKGFEDELNAIVKKYGVFEIDADYNELTVSFRDGNDITEFFLHGIGREGRRLSFELDD